MGNKIARVGDPLSHGGTITAGASRSKCNGLAIAREGDAVNCAVHGAQTIATGSGSPKFKVEGKPVAHVGSTTTCGATITDGSPNSYC